MHVFLSVRVRVCVFWAGQSLISKKDAQSFCVSAFFGALTHSPHHLIALLGTPANTPPTRKTVKQYSQQVCTIVHVSVHFSSYAHTHTQHVLHTQRHKDIPDDNGDNDDDKAEAAANSWQCQPCRQLLRAQALAAIMFCSALLLNKRYMMAHVFISDNGPINENKINWDIFAMLIMFSIVIIIQDIRDNGGMMA